MVQFNLLTYEYKEVSYSMLAPLWTTSKSLKVDDEEKTTLCLPIPTTLWADFPLHNRGVQVNIEEVAWCRFGFIFERAIWSTSRYWHSKFSSCWQMLEELRVYYAKVFCCTEKNYDKCKATQKIDEIAREKHLRKSISCIIKDSYRVQKLRITINHIPCPENKLLTCQ